MDYLYERFTRFIDDRRRHPQSDVMTAMATATFPDGSLPTVHDVMLIATNLFSAGGETTARLLGQMLKLIGERPELQQLLRAERERIPNFIEECLRLEPPIQSTFRLSRVATKIGGVPIPAGTTLMLLPGAANRDPRHWGDDADEFRPDRELAGHVGFGFGAHFCLGASLARHEATSALHALLPWLRADQELAGAAADDFIDSCQFRGRRRLELVRKEV